MQSHLLILLFLLVLFVSYPQKLLPKPRSRRFSAVFSFRSFTVSVLMFQSLIHFKIIFLSGVRQGSTVILLHVVIQFSQHQLLKKLSFPHCVFLAPLSHITWLYMQGLISGLLILFHSVPLVYMTIISHVLLITIALQYSLKSEA